MLNLEINKKYIIKPTTYGNKEEMLIISKTVHSGHIHSYFVSYGEQYGKYIWDSGIANSGRYYGSINDSYIQTCEEIK